MATISKLSFMTLFLMLANQLVHSQRDVSFYYDTFSGNPVGRKIHYQGGAHVPQGSDFLRLTQTDSSGLPLTENAGRVVSSDPIDFWNPTLPWPPPHATFDTTIHFRITPSQNGAGNGLAFFIAPVNTTIPTSSLFAVQFVNFVDGMYNFKRHIEIDIESGKFRNTTRFDSATGQLVTARITYIPWTTTISVVATSGSQTASLSYVIDLRTILPQQVQVGISATTGKTAAFHDLISWNFTSTLQPYPDNDEEAYIRKYLGTY